MMLLSRFWYAVLAVLAGVAVWAIFLAVGQYNRRAGVATNEQVAADAQVVRWAMQIDARRRLDAMLIGSADKGLQDALVLANDKDKVPQKAKEDAKKALVGINEKLPADYKEDALFAVDRDGRVISQVGYDKAIAFEDFGLGGYPAVNDALHGFSRDDTWVWGGQIYRVVARPVEYDVTQMPAGAIVGIKLIDRKYVQDISERTRANVAFYALGQRVASAGVQGFEEPLFDQILTELPNLAQDKSYETKPFSEVRNFGPDKTLSGVFQKIDGDSYKLAVGIAVVRQRTTLPGPMAFIQGADDTDKKAVNLPLVIAIVVFGLLIGLLLSLVEHDLPLRSMKDQAAKLKKGDFDLLQLARFRGAYRDIAIDLNTGIERVAEKGGGAPRKTADLEQVLGPIPAQPAMSAFAFPMANQQNVEIPTVPPASNPRPPTPAPPQAGPPRQSNAGPPPAVPRLTPAGGPPPPINPPRPLQQSEDDPTAIGQVPAEILAKATPGSEEAEWPGVYEDFIKTKKQCGEPTEGLTFDKFKQTLKKNRDALIARHNCKRVKFTVYIKDGRASLKATPVKE